MPESSNTFLPAILAAALFTVPALTVSAMSTRIEATQAIITLDPKTTYQTMTGWEATASLPNKPANPEWSPFYDALMEKAVKDLGINRIRLEIRTSAESNTDDVKRYLSGAFDYDEWTKYRYEMVNDNDDPHVINWDGFNFTELDWHIEETILPMREKLQARGERLFINLCYVSFRSGWYTHKDPEEYAELVLATYLHMRDKYGFIPDTWEVILEPDLEWDMWSGEEIGKAIVATSKRLKEHGFTPAFVVPSVTDMSNTLPYMEKIADVPGAMEHVVELAYHRYKGTSRRTLARIAEFAKEHGIQTSMLEWWFGRGTHDVLHEDLTVGHNTSWQGRVVRGLFKVQYNNITPTRIYPQPEMRYNRQYFRDVRYGAVRIGARSSEESRLSPVAFINTDGTTTLVVNAENAGEITVMNLPEGSYQISYAIESGSVIRPERISVREGEELKTHIPDEGVLTITSR